MPKIPVYERQFDQRSVNLNAPMQNINAPAEAFGGGNARALQGAGQDVSQLGRAMMATAARMKQEEDETKSLDAYLKYHDSVTTYLQGDGSEGSGAYNRMGGSALGLTKEAKDELEKRMQEISGTLTNPEQQALFNRRAAVLRSESLAGVSRHEAKERRTYQAETYKAVAGREFDYALLNYTDPGKIESSLARAEEAVRSAAKMQGLPAEATEQLVTSTRSEALKKIGLRHVKTGQYDEARKWMADERLSGEDRAAVQDALRPAEVADKADAIAEKLAASGMDKQGAQKWLMDNVEDLDVRRVAKSTFNALYASRKAEATAARQEAIYAAVDRVDSMDGDLMAQYKFVEAMPEGPVKNAAQRRYKEYASFEGISFKTNPSAYEDLAEAITYGEVNSTQALREDARAAKVSAKDLKRLDSLLTGKQKVTDTDLKNVWLVAQGIQNDGKVPVKLNDRQKRELFDFKQWAETKVKDTNRADDPAYLQKLADQWTMQGEKKGGSMFGYGKDVSFGKALADPTWLPDTDDDTAAQIRAKFNANPAVKEAWVRQYGDEDLAVRGYHRKLLEAGLGKLTKPQTEKPKLMR